MIGCISTLFFDRTIFILIILISRLCLETYFLRFPTG